MVGTAVPSRPPVGAKTGRLGQPSLPQKKPIMVAGSVLECDAVRRFLCRTSVPAISKAARSAALHEAAAIQ